jgi:hypothetical protein
MPVRAGPNKAAARASVTGKPLHLSVNAYAQMRPVLIRGFMYRRL